MSSIKTCRRCKKEKQIVDFYKCAKSKDGRFSYCKQCQDVERKSRGRSNPEKDKEQGLARSKKWKEENLEKFRLQIKRRNVDRRVNLKDSYVAKLIGLSVENCGPALIEAKRQQLLHLRELRELKKTIVEKLKENNEP